MEYFNNKQKLSLFRSLSMKTAPAYVQFYITARCNLACEQCNIIYADANSKEMSIDEIKKTAENLAEIGVCIVLLIGGEPFVRKDLSEIVKCFTDVNIHVRLQTNGLATPEMIEACVKNGAHDISISLDSLRPKLQDTINGGYNKSWDRAIETMAIVNKVFPDNGTAFFNSVIMERNLKDLEGVIKFATAIGWGVSIVPVHTSTPENPRGYRTFDDNNIVNSPPERYQEIKETIENMKSLRKSGYNLYDSDEYLDDIYNFMTGKPLRWRRRNNNICDSPNLYFAIAPNGNMKVCCDFELEKRFPVYDKKFPEWYRDGVVHKQVYKYTKSCDGCMYGSYPEITISARYIKPMWDRFLMFNKNTKPLKKLDANQLKEIAENILNEKASNESRINIL